MARVSMRMIRRITVAVFFASGGAACGSLLDVPDEVGFGDASDGLPGRDGAFDGPPRDGDAADGSALDGTTRRCDATKPFGPPKALLKTDPGGGVADEAPRLSMDELTLVFSRNPEAQVSKRTAQIWVARRSAIGETFGDPELWFAMDGGSRDPVLSADGRTVYFTTTPPASGGVDDIYAVARTDWDGGFGVPKPVRGLAELDFEQHPFVSPASAEIFFSIKRSGTPDFDLHAATLNTFGDPSASGLKPIRLSTAEPDFYPVVSADGLTIYFSSKAQDAGQQIFRSRRTDIDAAFAPLSSVAELNTDDDDFPGWLSPDECRLYLWRRKLDVSDGRLFVAERAP